MKWSCPAVLVFVATKVQLEKRVVAGKSDDALRYTVDPGVDAKVQSIAINVPRMLMDPPCRVCIIGSRCGNVPVCVGSNGTKRSLSSVHKGKGTGRELVFQ